MASFTIRLANLAESGPVVEVNVIPTGLYTEVFDPRRKTPPKPVGITAMFDTGATGSVIQIGIPGRLGLNPTGFTIISTASSARMTCLQYDLRLVFPNNVGVEGVFAELDLPGQSVQCLIGRDVLRHGVFIYTGYDNSYTFSV